MLFILRKIRRSFFLPGKVRTYVAYAVGEIVLIVVGILIAVQITDWNENIKNRKLEIEYLVKLNTDLNLDSSDLFSSIQRACVNLVLIENALVKLKADTSILRRGTAYHLSHVDVSIEENKLLYKNDFLTSDNFSLETFGHQLTQITMGRGFDLTQTTINDLISTGKIEVLQKQSLKDDIQSYYGYMQAGIGTEGDISGPHRAYYRNILNELGIPPWSKLTELDVIELTSEDERLIVALYNLYDAYHRIIGIIYANQGSFYSRIERLKSEIANELKALR